MAVRAAKVDYHGNYERVTTSNRLKLDKRTAAGRFNPKRNANTCLPSPPSIFVFRGLPSHIRSVEANIDDQYVDRDAGYA